MFCKICLDVLQKLKDRIRRDDEELLLLHHNRAAALKTAAESGCRLCHALWSQLSVDQQAFLESSDKDFPQPDEHLSLPGIEEDDDESWKVRRNLMDSGAVFAVIMPAHAMFKEVGEEPILLCLMIYPNRQMPETNYSKSMSLFLLQLLEGQVAEGMYLLVIIGYANEYLECGSPSAFRNEEGQLSRP